MKLNDGAVRTQFLSLFVPTASSSKYKSLLPAPPAGSMADSSNVLARLGVTLETDEAGKCIINGHSVRTITSQETGATVVSIIDVIAAVNSMDTKYAGTAYLRLKQAHPEVSAMWKHFDATVNER
jgi:hypothetical protein